jgi:hypothetical protein
MVALAESFRKYQASLGGHSTMQHQRVARCPRELM